MIRAICTILLVFLISACSTNPAALSASTYNRSAILNIRLGQSMTEVQRVMGKAPESQTSKLLDNGEQEVRWYYLTDYVNEINTEITFRNNRVVEMKPTQWLGNGAFVVPPKKM